MKKNLTYTILLILAITISACSSDDSDASSGNPDTPSRIAMNFGTTTGNITRAVGIDAARMLDYKFQLYGSKVAADGTTRQNVFAFTDNPKVAANQLYTVWFNNEPMSTSTNSTGWEYAGSGSFSLTYGEKRYPIDLTNEQTIKYWDYDASQYDFIAFSNTGEAQVTDVDQDGFLLQASPSELDNLFVVDKVTLTNKADYGKTIPFTFRRSSVRVRLGIYETIPGYYVRNIRFRPTTESDFTATNTSAILSGKFFGQGEDSTATQQTLVVSFNDGKAVYSPTPPLTEASYSKYFNFGNINTAFTSNTVAAEAGIGTSAAEPTWAKPSADDTDGYVVAAPCATSEDMILYVDYDLYKPQTGETIKVLGAMARVPAPFTLWSANFAYTYLFKISDNTNGTTGTEGTTAQGLFPITFDALAITDYDSQGTTTVMSAPAITTYQDGSVSTTGVTYATTNGDIYVTVSLGNTLQTLTATNLNFYKVGDTDTEATIETTLASKTDAEREAMKCPITVGAAAVTQGNITFPANQHATFQVTEAGKYAIAYTYTPTGSTTPTTVYKIVKVTG